MSLVFSPILMFKDSLKTIALSLIVLFLVGVAYAWTEPTVSPPNQDPTISKPLTESKTGQIKAGGLWIGSDAGSIVDNKGLIVENGNVGIGVIGPLEKLSVAGEIKTAGGIKFSDGSTQTTALGANSYFVTGTYDGDGVDGREIEVGFQPDDVTVGAITNASGNAIMHRNKYMNGFSQSNNDSSTYASDYITSLTPKGFTVGTVSNVNAVGYKYWFNATKGGSSPNLTPTIINFSADKTLIANNHPFDDQPVVLSWNVTGASSCSASDGGSSTTWSANKLPFGSETVYPKFIDFDIDRTFNLTLTCYNIDKSKSDTKSIAMKEIGWKRVAQTAYPTLGTSCTEWLNSNNEAGVGGSSPMSNDTSGLQGNAEINNRCMYAANQNVEVVGYPDGVSTGWTYSPSLNISVKSFAPGYKNNAVWPVGEYNGGGGIEYFGTYSRFIK